MTGAARRTDLARLLRRYALTCGLLAIVAALLFLGVFAARADVARLEEEQALILSQMFALGRIETDARRAPGRPAAALSLTRDLRAQIDQFVRSRRCPVDGRPGVAIDEAVAPLFHGASPNLCEHADAFVRIARGVVAGGPRATALLPSLAWRIGPINEGLSEANAIYQSRIEAARGRELLLVAAAAAVTLATFAAQALLVFRPGMRAALLDRRRGDAALARAEATASELRTALAALEAARREAVVAHRAAERADRMKAEFLARLSHEVRTPLNGVIGVAALLDVSARPDQRARLAVIREAGRSLLDMVDDTIDLARFVSGDDAFETRPYELCELILALCADVAERGRVKGVAVETEIDRALAGCVLGDERRVGRALRALLDNAVKFTDQGRIRISARLERDDALLFSVADSGPGVPSEAREAIFAHFAQLDGSETRPKGGVGQGLALARLVLRAMGGEVGVGDSDFGGARFWLRLPLMRLETPGTGAVRRSG